MKILRLGGLNSPASRLLDILADERIEKIDLIVPESDVNNIKDIYNTAKYFNNNNILEKLSYNSYELSFSAKIKRKIIRKMEIKTLYPTIYKFLKKYKSKDFDLIWIGDNDFDGSNDLFIAAREIFYDRILIRSYKETRFHKYWPESEMIKNADAIIFPNEGYIEFFKKLYNFRVNSYVIADLDWRYSKTIEWVNSLKVNKISMNDNYPHVCILTGRALSDPSEERSGERYYFLPIISELIKRNIYVHMHALRLVPSKGQDIDEYTKLSRISKNFIIEKPLRLYAGSEDYKILKRYDAGILHPDVSKDNYALYEFQKINIPNRIYEYQIADVVPLQNNGSSEYTKMLVEKTGYGIIYENFDDLAERLFKLINEKHQLQIKKINTYADFGNVLIDKALKLNKKN